MAGAVEAAGMNLVGTGPTTAGIAAGTFLSAIDMAGHDVPHFCHISAEIVILLIESVSE